MPTVIKSNMESKVEVKADADYMSFEEFSRIIDAGQVDVRCSVSNEETKRPASLSEFVLG